ncbi:hypothetical protein DUF188 [Gottschalkia acidurici 9a]|uniref:UPF0178 protein Curi_c11330 n=1 Tax=Gottschalkia acidurici (strain ATCC 7906 / DSM 604 / BCRC 14475 / CIP 104303 / KCTC 5404 / NCIMB 10678 / 9a) TaxID=1128398 RepID=K0AZD1_GOTA9|nr:DUF188 domain-containing protein [Gottschalkia acidurici]AFS78147.1 hypothetical protein DUF188 [Gottschalkia acidurici 9a]
MKILIDADGCPVVKIAIEVAKEYRVEVLVVKNYSHEIEDTYATIITVDNSSDSADYYIVNKAGKGDIVVTQDYGLCGMALAKGAICINQNGLIISDKNIEELLSRRHINREIRRKEGKYTKFKKRSNDDNVKFRNKFRALVEELH